MYKQVIIVRKDLNMSVGKISGQVSHAAMAFLTTDIQNNISKWLSSDGTTYYSTELTFDQDTYEQWIGDVFTKVVCGAKNKNQLLNIKKCPGRDLNPGNGIRSPTCYPSYTTRA